MSQYTYILGNQAVLLPAVTATGTGQELPTGSFNTYVFEVYGTATDFALHIEAVGPSGTARVIIKVWDELNGDFLSGSDITAEGFYSVSVPAFTKIRANVTSIAGGTVSISGGLLA